MSQLFGYLSAALWVGSSIAWIWSAATKAPVSRHPEASDQGIEFFASGPPMSVNGVVMPEADEFFAYQQKVFMRNAIAAGLSAAGAICAAIAVAAS